MRVFDKLARDNLRAAIKLKEIDYVRSYAELQLQTSPSRNHSVARTTESEWKALLIRDSTKYSFPQQTRKATIREVSRSK